MSGKRAQQRGIGQRDPLPGQRRGQQQAVIIGGADRDHDALVRHRHAERVAHVHVHERRDIEAFAAMLFDDRPRCTCHSRVAIDGNQIGVALMEGIVNFVEDGGKRAVALITEIDAQGVEAIAENPRHAEQPDRAAIGGKAGGPQMAHLLFAKSPDFLEEGVAA